VNVTPKPDLTVALTHTGTAQQAKSGFAYTITVSNVGIAPTAGTVTVADALPTGMTAAAIGGAGWTCMAGAPATCTRTDALAPNSAYPPITLTVLVAPDAPPSVTNTATVSGGGETNTANDTATDQTVVRPRPDPTTDPDVVGLVNAQIAAAQRFANAQISNFNDRLEALHDDNPADRYGLQFGQNDNNPRLVQNPGSPFDRACAPRCNEWAQHPTAVNALAYADEDVARQTAPSRPQAPRDWHAWSSGIVSFGSADANAQRSSFSFTTAGVSAGFDYRFAPSFTVGLGAGYGRDTSQIGGNGTRSNAETANLALYGSWRPAPGIFVDGVAGWGYLWFNSQRFVVDDAEFVSGSRTGNQAFGSLTASYEFRGDGWLVSPYARVNGAWLALDAFSETGGSGALSFFDQQARFLTGVLGLRGKTTVLTDFGVVSPRMRVEYLHDALGTSAVSLRYADTLTGPTYGFTTAPTERDRIAVGLGAELGLTEAWRLDADYQYDTDFVGARMHTLRLKLQSRF
jgi:outer membrane autotransporter protein